MILNFAAGAIVGAAMTYVFKDQDTKEKMMSGIGSLKKKTEELTGTDADDEKAEVVETAETQVEEVQAEKTA